MDIAYLMPKATLMFASWDCLKHHNKMTLKWCRARLPNLKNGSHWLQALDKYNPRCHSPKCRERITFNKKQKAEMSSLPVTVACPYCLPIPQKNWTNTPPLDSFTKELKTNTTLKSENPSFYLIYDEILTNFWLLHKMQIFYSPKIMYISGNMTYWPV